MRKIFSILLILALQPAAAAECPGEDRLAALADADRRALEEAAAAHPHAEGLLWRAERDGRVLHLVGTMHLHDPRHQATLNRIAPMLDTAGTVYLEMAAGDEARLQQMIAENPSLAFLTDGPTLPDLLGEADWARLKAALADRGMPAFLGAKMKPWMAMANLALTRCDLENARAGRLGLDGMVIAAAEARGLPTKALEPLDTALRLFAEFSEEEQLELLRLGLAQQTGNSADHAVTVAEAYFREQIQLIWEYTMWQSQEVPGFTSEMLAEQAERLEEVLVTRRNRAWMQPILSGTQDAVIAVGAMHLPGEAGLLRLLEDEGFAITRLPLAP